MARDLDVLDKTLYGCESSNEEVVSLMYNMRNCFRLMEKEFGADIGITAFRAVSEIIIGRVEGANPDISTIADACGVSRDTLRRVEAKLRGRVEPYAEVVQEGRRRVYDPNEGISPNTARVFDGMIKTFKS